jgi:guanosine-3',5'-bis(diphosphate) 3'-pyrophosphohydrolase
MMEGDPMNLNLMTKNTALIERARAFAREKHKTQLRKYTNLPYYTHLENVADIVAFVSNDDKVIAAAVLHDTLEDTATTYDGLVATFGKRVADLVREVTDVSTKADGNRATRKNMDLKHLAKASADGQTIKLADLIDNTDSIMKYDPKFAKLYLAEKRLLLDVLTLGNPILWEAANRNVGLYG